MKSIEFRKPDEEWVVLGSERRVNDSGSVILAAEEMKLITATDLRNALMREAQHFGAEEANAHITLVPMRYVDHESPGSELYFHFSRASTTLSLVIEDWGNGERYLELDESEYVGRVTRLLTPLAARHRMSITYVEMNEYSDFPVIGYSIGLKFPTHGKSLSYPYQIGRSILEILRAATEGIIDRRSVADLIRGGHASLLLGQEENSWFDAKVDHYALSQLGGKISLAQSVARFANAEEGGLVVVGVKTKTAPGGGEIVTAVNGVPWDRAVERRYLQALNQCLYPPPDMLSVQLVRLEDSERMLVLVEVPPQPEELKPFLVHGAIVDGKAEGAFISIVRRRGEGSIPTTAPMIHSTISAGRAFLRGNASGREDRPAASAASEDTDRSDGGGAGA